MNDVPEHYCRLCQHVYACPDPPDARGCRGERWFLYSSCSVGEQDHDTGKCVIDWDARNTQGTAHELDTRVIS